MPPCLTLSSVKYISRVNRAIPTPQYISYLKGSLWVALEHDQVTHIYILMRKLILYLYQPLLQNQNVT